MTSHSPEWKEYRIKDLGRVVTGHTPLKSVKEFYESNDYAWIKPTDIRKGERYVPETEEFYSQKAFEKFKNSLLPPLSTCVVTIGTVGEKICLTHKPCFSNQSINAIVPDRQKFDPMFVYYLLKSNLDQVAQRNPGTSSGRDHVSKSNISSIIVKAPLKQTQSKISAILARYDDLLENNARRIKILEEMAQAIYREWFVNFRFPGHESVRMVESELGLVPEGWEIRKLGDIIELLYGKGLKTEDREEGLIPVYGSSGIIGYHNRFLEKGPGIIVGRKGNVGSVYWSDTDFFPIDTVYYVKSKLPMHYIFYNLQTQNFLNNDAAVPGLNRNQAYSLPIVIPDSDTLIEFEKISDDFFNSIKSLESKNTNLRRTCDHMLPKLISGEIDVSGLDIEIPAA